MAQNKRLAIKHVRDKAKAAYQKAGECFICGSQELLELHHYNGMTQLLESWAKQRGYKLDTDDEVLAVRDEFISEHYSQIYKEVVTLCKKHHAQLHKIYGLSPLLSTAKKQASWVEKQRAKYKG